MVVTSSEEDGGLPPADVAAHIAEALDDLVALANGADLSGCAERLERARDMAHRQAAMLQAANPRER